MAGARGQRQGVAVQAGVGSPPVQTRTSARNNQFVKVSSTATPEQIARAMDDVYEKINKVDTLVTSIPFMGSGAIYVRDVEFTALSSVYIKHRFGRKVRFMVMNHRGGADVVYRPTANLDDETTLELYPGQTFTADVLVWRD